MFGLAMMILTDVDAAKKRTPIGAIPGAYEAAVLLLKRLYDTIFADGRNGLEVRQGDDRSLYVWFPQTAYQELRASHIHLIFFPDGRWSFGLTIRPNPGNGRSQHIWIVELENIPTLQDIGRVQQTIRQFPAAERIRQALVAIDTFQDNRATRDNYVANMTLLFEDFTYLLDTVLEAYYHRRERDEL